MNKDFSQYQKIIDQLRGVAGTSEFEVQFQEATKRIAKTDRFLLKMELKRLGQPCTRLIDLRGNVDGECQSYEHETRVHFMDDVAIAVFEENMQAYGKYTFGVYEACNSTPNNFRVIYQQEKQQIAKPITTEPVKQLEKVQYPAKFHQFCDYSTRIEERMNFAIPVKVIIGQGEEVDATSIDISVRGCKIRFNDIHGIDVGQQIQISFIGLEQEFSFGEKNSFTYEVCNLLLEEKIQIIGAKRITEKQKDGFSQFLHGFIQGNKRRYKINLDNTINALQSRTLEQFSLPKVSELPVFMALNNGEYIPQYALTTNNNHDISQYWQDEARHSALHYLLSASRVERLMRAAKLGRSLLVYSFIHENQGKRYFYTADDKQLASETGLLHDFVAFAAQKDSFAVTELKAIEVDAKYADTPFTIAGGLPKSLAYLDQPMSDEEKVTLAKLPIMVIATNITTNLSREEYASLDASTIEARRIKLFGHKREVLSPACRYLGINYRNQRNEQRFVYKTPVSVEVESVAWQGVSEDFSVSGLKVNLEKAAILRKGEIVYLTFPNLQKITSQFELKKLPYEVVRINKDKTVINLRVHVQQHQHIGRKFFKALIDKNQGKLTADEYSMMSPLLAKGLRNIYAKYTPVPNLFVQTSGSRYKVEAIGAGEVSKFIQHTKALSDRPYHYNLYPLLNHSHILRELKPVLKNLQPGDAPVTEQIFISIKQNAEIIEKAVTTKLASDLKTVKLKKMFIANALKYGTFYSLMIKLSRAEEPDMDYLSPELSYIGSYAIHRGKQIEQDIWSTIGVIQVFDVTQETTQRYQLVPVAETQVADAT